MFAQKVHFRKSSWVENVHTFSFLASKFKNLFSLQRKCVKPTSISLKVKVRSYSETSTSIKILNKDKIA